MKKLFVLCAVILVAGLLLTACGGSSGASTDLKLEMTDFAFSPTTFTIPAGKEITLEASNTGKVEHEFVIMKLGLTATIPFSDDDEPNIFWEVEVEAGETQKVTFTAPSEPGEYQIVCGIEGHLEANMVGKLIVK